jgi:multidrug resistance efflux pump
MAKPQSKPKRKSSPDAERIAELEDDLKQRDLRVKGLRADLDKAEALISEMREQVEDVDGVIEAWIEAFRMVQGDNGNWNYDEWTANCVEYRERYIELLKDWNRFVPLYNAAVAPQQRNFGRPLGADKAQRAAVLKLHAKGTSLRGIAEELELGVRTVRTIVDQRDGVDRTTVKHLARIDPDRKEEALWRAHSRVRKTLPQRINATLAKGRELVKQAKGLK